MKRERLIAVVEEMIKEESALPETPDHYYVGRVSALKCVLALLLDLRE